MLYRIVKIFRLLIGWIKWPRLSASGQKSFYNHVASYWDVFQMYHYHGQQILKCFPSLTLFKFSELSIRRAGQETLTPSVRQNIGKPIGSWVWAVELAREVATCATKQVNIRTLGVHRFTNDRWVHLIPSLQILNIHHSGWIIEKYSFALFQVSQHLNLILKY